MTARRTAQRRAFRAVIALGGTIATAAGAHTVLAGARSLADRRPADDPVLESELRFYAAYYAAFGVALLRIAPRADEQTAAVRAAAAALALAGLARATAWASTGSPHPLQRGLLAVELAAPPAVVAWQTRLRRFA